MNTSEKECFNGTNCPLLMPPPLPSPELLHLSYKIGKLYNYCQKLENQNVAKCAVPTNANSEQEILQKNSFQNTPLLPPPLPSSELLDLSAKVNQFYQNVVTKKNSRLASNVSSPGNLKRNNFLQIFHKKRTFKDLTIPEQLDAIKRKARQTFQNRWNGNDRFLQFKNLKRIENNCNTFQVPKKSNTTISKQNYVKFFSNRKQYSFENKEFYKYKIPRIRTKVTSSKTFIPSVEFSLIGKEDKLLQEQYVCKPFSIKLQRISKDKLLEIQYGCKPLSIKLKKISSNMLNNLNFQDNKESKLGIKQGSSFKLKGKLGRKRTKRTKWTRRKTKSCVKVEKFEINWNCNIAKNPTYGPISEEDETNAAFPLIDVNDSLQYLGKEITQPTIK